jgi:AraC family transcriptional regulator
MPHSFRYLRAEYYEGDPAPARALRRYHVREQETAGLIATETSHPPRFTIPSHSHDLYSFYLVLEGSLTEFSDGTRHELDRNTLVFTPAGHIHRNSFDDAGGRCLLVELTSSWSAHLAAAGLGGVGPIVAREPELTRIGIQLYQEFRCPDRASSLAVEGLTLELLAAFARRRGLHQVNALPGWLRRARDLLHDRLMERLTLAELAGEVGVHPIHLLRAFRRRYRCSPAEYQRNLRVEHASRLLATTQRPLAEVAQATGFADQPHFSRVFKERTGLTPGQFRAMHAVG